MDHDLLAGELRALTLGRISEPRWFLATWFCISQYRGTGCRFSQYHPEIVAELIQREVDDKFVEHLGPTDALDPIDWALPLGVMVANHDWSLPRPSAESTREQASKKRSSIRPLLMSARYSAQNPSSNCTQPL